MADLGSRRKRSGIFRVLYGEGGMLVWQGARGVMQYRHEIKNTRWDQFRNHQVLSKALLLLTHADFAQQTLILSKHTCASHPSVEDGDPAALPGTEREWRGYRIQVRAWKEGAEGYPDSEHRPARPN